MYDAQKNTNKSNKQSDERKMIDFYIVFTVISTNYHNYYYYKWCSQLSEGGCKVIIDEGDGDIRALGCHRSHTLHHERERLRGEKRRLGKQQLLHVR